MGALFESFERWAAERAPYFRITASQYELRAVLPSIDLVTPRVLNASYSLDWVIGFNPFTKQNCLVPLNRVLFPIEDARHGMLEGSSSTDGIAAGTTPLEAVCAAICETLERHAVRHLDASNLYKLDLHTIPQDSREIVDKFEAVGIELTVVYCPSPSRVPVFYVLSRDEYAHQGFFFCWGSGCHVNANIALNRALLEVSQSRVSFISALTPDVAAQMRHLDGQHYHERRNALDPWFRATPTMDYQDTQIESASTFRGLLNILGTRFQAAFEDHPACVILHDESGLYACRVFAPILED